MKPPVAPEKAKTWLKVSDPRMMKSTITVTFNDPSSDL